MKLNDVKLVFGGADFDGAVSKVQLYANDKTTLIKEKTVNSNIELLFEGLDYVVAQGTENIYVKVVTEKIGKDAV